MLKMKNLSGSWIFLLLSTGFAFSLKSVLQRSYRYNIYPASWAEARNICRRYYTDLATVYSKEDVKYQNLGRYYAWIGLDGQRSQWSDLVLSGGKGYFLDSLENQTIIQSAKCIAASYHIWYYDSKALINRIYGLNCGSDFFFICHDTQGYYDNEYIFVPEAKNWSEAQQYCNENDKELANIDGSDLDNIVQNKDFPIWIGLYRDGGSWNWTESPSEYKSWETNEPSSNGDCVSMSSETFNMAAQNCDKRLPFLCIWDNVVLVKENRSWEEALEHCRGLGSSSDSDLSYDLLSLQPGEEQAYMVRKVLEADSKEVWTGLRFLAGDWLWVNGADMLHTDLPSCPTLGQHCGALSKDEAVGVKPWDCLERKNFLCYSYKHP